MRISSAFTIAGVAFGVAAFAQGSQAADLYARPNKAVPIQPVSNAWTIELGIEGRIMPRWEGSDRYIAVPVPRFDIRRAGTPPRFGAPRDGFGIGIFDVGNFRIGPVAKLRLDRRERDDRRNLTGLGDIDYTLELGGFAEYYAAPWLRTRAEVRQGIGGHEGLVADLTADVLFPVTTQLLLSAGPRVSFASARAESPYYSITPGQSIASGLPVFNARGGVHSYGAGAQARYRWTPQWTTYIFAEYERLSGDAGDSPLVRFRGDPNQVTAGAAITYSFDVDLPFLSRF